MSEYIMEFPMRPEECCEFGEVKQELIRCKKCRYSHAPYYNTVKCSIDGRVHIDDWFCASGEKNESSTNMDS